MPTLRVSRSRPSIQTEHFPSYLRRPFPRLSSASDDMSIDADTESARQVLAAAAAMRAALLAADRGAAGGADTDDAGLRVPAYACAMGLCRHCGFYRRTEIKSTRASVKALEREKNAKTKKNRIIFV